MAIKNLFGRGVGFGPARWLATRGFGSGDAPVGALAVVRAPRYIDFDDSNGPLKLYEGEMYDVPMVLRGGGSAVQDLTGATSIKWTVGVAGQTPVVAAVDLELVGAATTGRVKYAAASPLAAAGGRYKSLVVVTFPGGVVVKFPGDVLVESAIA